MNKQKRKIGFTCGTFDLIHPRHILMFEECKEHCDYLIVGLQIDPTIDRHLTKMKPVQTIQERLKVLKGLKYIDGVVVYETEKDLWNFLYFFKDAISIRFLGDDWKNKQYTGYDIPMKKYFNKRLNHNWSVTELKRRIING